MCTFISFVSLLRMHNFSIANYMTHSTVVINFPVVTTEQTCYLLLDVCFSQIRHKSPKKVARPCHSQSTLSLTSHHGGTGSLIRRFTWDLWLAKRQCDRFYGAHHLSPPISIPPVLHIHPSAICSDGEWGHYRLLFQETESHTTPIIKTMRFVHTCAWEYLVQVVIIHS